MPNDADTKSHIKGKHRKLTCSSCRRRKSKCDGKHPKCTTCIAYKDECVYDKAPSLAYVRSLEDELQELKNQLKAVKTQAWLNKGATGATQDEQKIAPAPASSSDSPTMSRDSGSRRNSAFLPRLARQVKWETDISVDDHGSVTFHGSTSAVHEPPNIIQPSTLSPPPFEPPTRFDDQRTKQDLVSNANKQKQLEGFGIANSAAKINLPREVSEELLKYHWCWIHPLFIFVYRPAFTRGMTLVNNSQPGAPDPPYFSETLLRVMHAHCARFLNHSVYQRMGMQAGQASPQPLTASEFMHNMTHEARVSLGMETLKPSAIPTIQALLQQSAREIVFGRSSQGWLYGGMAFRMAFDMGIHLPSDKLQTIVKSLSAEDIEIRKRLFWSCYAWDKILSLYLGRMPGFTPTIDDVPLVFMDDYSDSDLWYPYYGETPGPEVSSNPAYTPCPGYVVSCFQHLCKLTIILCDLLENIYSSEASRRNEEGQSPGRIESPYMRVSRDLQHWWTSLPAHLKIRPDQMPLLAPPVHIMALNLLYHTTLILLNRPLVLGSPDDSSAVPQRSYQTCLSATAAIHDLLLLQANTFGLSHVSYLNAYCAYTAATVAILRLERDLKPGEDHTTIVSNIGLNMLLEVLQRTSAAMPALERSYAIIRKRMNAVLERHQRNHPSSFLPSPSTSATPMPALAGCSTAQTILAQPTAFQAISNPALAHGGFHAHIPSDPSDPSNSFMSSGNMPLQWQSDMRSSLSFDPANAQSAFTGEWLPAFPGQQFPVGSEHSFGSNDVDTPSKMAMLGFNLDPHPRLNPGDIDWSIMEGFESGASATEMKFQPNGI